MKRSASLLLVFFFPIVLTAGTVTVFNVRDYGATGNGTTDDGAAITSAANAMQAAGGGTLYFPPGTYKIYSTGTTYRYLTAFGGTAQQPASGYSIIGDDATLAIDPTNPAPQAESWGAIFAFANVVNVKIDGFNVTGPNMDITTTAVKGIVFALFYDGVVNVSMPHNTVQGVQAGVNVVGTPNNTTNPSRDFDIGVLNVKNAWYGFAGQHAPSNVRIGLMRTDTIMRSYIVYGIRNHTVNIIAKDAYGIDCYLWAPAENINIENVTLNYTSNEDYVNSSNGSHRIGIVYGGGQPNAVRNVRLHVNVTFATPPQGQSNGSSVLQIQKWDTADHGYVLENLTLSGVIRGTPTEPGLPVVGSYPDDVWGQGDTWRNIRLENLRVESNKTLLFNLGALKGPFTISGVSSDSAIFFRESPSDPNPPRNGSYAIVNSDFPNMSTMLVNQARSLDPIVANVSQTIPTGWSGHTVSQDFFAGSNITYTLPPAKAGLDYTFARVANVAVSIQPNGSESIRGFLPGQAVSLVSVGATIRLRCLLSAPNPSFGTSVPVWEIVSSTP